MYLHIKRKGRHSALCENAIRTIKRTLYLILRRKGSQNWAKYLSQAVNTVNHNFNPGIGNLQPAICNQDLELGDQMIHDRLKDLGKSSTHLLTIEQQRNLKRKTETDSQFRDYLPGKTVLLDLPMIGPREFKKETFAKRAQIFLVHSLDFRQVPIMFKLTDINGKRIKGKSTKST